MELSELVKLIRGEKGTTVHLEIYRPSTEENLSFDVERQDITLPSVSHKMFEDGIGYVHIDSFETETATQFEEAVKDLEDQGMKALIIDVRYNPGGMVTAVVQILDDILPEGTVLPVPKVPWKQPLFRPRKRSHHLLTILLTQKGFPHKSC